MRAGQDQKWDGGDLAQYSHTDTLFPKTGYSWSASTLGPITHQIQQEERCILLYPNRKKGRRKMLERYMMLKQH